MVKDESVKSTNDQQIASEESETSSKGGITRRNFLKIIGGTTVAGAVGCSEKAVDTVLPYVKSQPNTITGKAVWYNTTCSECAAGCGVMVRTREGRAVKIEGNPSHPVNRGGVCAIGHSALQNLYDPDRIRQPLRRVGEKFEPISWAEAYVEIGEALKNSKGKKVIVDAARPGTLNKLTDQFCRTLGVERVAFDSSHSGAEVAAAKQVYGVDGAPTYALEKAEVLVNFGADFMETWHSPCEYARSWADSRKGKHPIRVFHIEPRLSLTGANADHWLSCNPGTEVRVALALLKLVFERNHGSDLNDDVRSKIKNLVADINIQEVATTCGVAEEKMLLMAQHLADAGHSLVLAGGSSSATGNPMGLHVAVNLLNLILGNVGTTVNIARRRERHGDLRRMVKLIEELNKDKVGVLIVDGSNPVFNLPSNLGIDYALKKAALIVSLASHLDETTQNAHFILPSNTGLESWSDVHSVSGVYGLVQPSMLPVFDTRNQGDIIIELAKSAGKDVSDGNSDFLGYLKSAWKQLQAQLGESGDSKQFWLACVERGGYFVGRPDSQARVSVSPDAFKNDFSVAKFDSERGHDDVLIYPFASVRSFDGSAANRPWLHEIPDPIAQVVWDAWAEVHPDTAASHGLAKGDMVTIRNYYGEVNLPIYLTPYVRPGMVAMPIGHGHRGFGRFAKGVGGNVMELLSGKLGKGSHTLALVNAKASLIRGRGQSTLVNVQGSDSQHGRGLARTAAIVPAVAAHNAASHHEEAHNGAHSGGEHHEFKQMYKQREHPLYKWGLNVDLASCTGCSACVVACYAENNIAVVGKEAQSKGREMSWLRIERYYDGSADELQVSFLPMMCQHCGSAPCEPVCPVYATYHNEEGLNVMVYNRCVGTRYCSNNCSYKVRRFNWYEYTAPEPLNWQFNPDVTPRVTGVMEKCSFCVQRITEAKDKAKDIGREVIDGDVKPACVQSCPTQALTFGNLNDPHSAVSQQANKANAYKVLDHHLNTQPSVSYLENRKYRI